MTVIHSDCLDAMRAMPADSVDSIVSDPPYGLAFMGKAWDSFGWDSSHTSKPGIGERATEWVSHGDALGGANPTCATCGGRKRGAKRCLCEQPDWRVKGQPLDTRNIASVKFYEFSLAWAAEALRVAKPGAHLVAFGGTRTYHRLAVAIEDAGWEIRDCLSWLYGSGFPKSMNVSKALEAHETLGGSHTVMMRKAAMGDDYTESDAKGTFRNGAEGAMNSVRTTPPEFSPTTDLARQWQGWGTALKPAWEPIILARKPLIGTVAANVTQYGTGALNVDATRIGSTDKVGASGRWGFRSDKGWNANSVPSETSQKYEHTNGRWPANVCLDEDAAGMFPESRFFYTAKASRREREAGLEGMPEREYPVAVIQTHGVGLHGESLNGKQVARSRNHHPTVKPIALMRWLVRLVTPPNGLVLDPFTGSGTTGCAAVLEGFRFVGCEREAEYVAIAEKRIAYWAGQKASEPEPSLF